MTLKLVSQNFSDILEPNIAMKKFPDSDNYICLPQTGNDAKEAIVFHRLYPEQDSSLMQAILILDTLKRKKINATLVSPYLPYARQDKIFKDGEALSAEVIADILHYAGARQLVTIDCHFMKKEGVAKYNKLEIVSISANHLLVEHAKKLVGNVEVISPDMGASYLVEDFGGKSMEKKRGDYVQGSTAYRKIESVKMDFDVSGKNILILDDMVSTGGTMLKAVENVKKGGAKKVLCAATHGLFLGDSLKKLQSSCDHVFATDSIFSSVSEVSIKPLLAKFI